MTPDRYRELFERSADASLVLAGGRFVACNEAAVRMLGCHSREEVLDIHPSQLSPPRQPDGRSSYDKANEMIAVALQQGSHRFEWVHVRADGEAFPVEVLLTVLEGGDPPVLHVVWRDITARKRAEKALQDNLAFLKSIIENLPICVKVVARDGTLLDLNPAGLSMIGATAKDAVVAEDVYALIHEDDRDAFVRFNERVCGGEKAALDYRMIDLDGTTHHMSSVGVPLPYGPRGQTVHLGITRDVTEERAARREKARLEVQLRQAQKMESIGRLAGGVAHDFNNVLTTILGYSDLILMGLPSGAPFFREIEMIRNAAERAAGLTQQLLAFSRKQVIETRLVSINAIVHDLVKLLGKVIGEDIEIQVAAEAVRDTIEADPSQIEQVLMNLAVNARDAMPLGGHLVIETQDVALGPEYARAHPEVRPGRYVMISVTDFGEGMSQEVLDQAFDPFFTTKEQGKGTGLGLATVYGIVKQHDGHVYAYSEPGKGTTFKVYFPASDGSVDPAGEDVRADRLHGTETVLVVDDEPAIRQMTADALGQFGYRCITAGGGQDAIERTREILHDIDVLVTDVIMPGMSGRELADTLTARNPSIKVLFFSGYTENVIAHHGILDEGVHFLQKPVKPTELVRKIRTVLDG